MEKIRPSHTMGNGDGTCGMPDIQTSDGSPPEGQSCIRLMGRSLGISQFGKKFPTNLYVGCRCKLL